MEQDKERGIIIVGAGQVGKAAEEMLRADVDAVNPHIVINNLEVKNALREMSGEVSVGNITYTQVENKHRGVSPTVARMASLAASMIGRKRERVRPNIDLVAEYRLILAKKSKLSRNDRDWVEAEFHKLFKIKSHGTT